MSQPERTDPAVTEERPPASRDSGAPPDAADDGAGETSGESAGEPGGAARTDRADHPGPPDLAFSLAGLRAGFRAGVPVSLGVAGYGLVFGVLARQAGLSVAAATAMSATVLAGAAQLVAVELLPEASVGAVVLATLLVNLRYLLMGAALHPWFRHLDRWQAYGSLAFTADENWALTMAEFREGGRRGAFLLGSGLAVWTFWVAATAVGATTGGLVAAPERFGLDFVFVAVFLTLAASLWEGRSDLAPWGLALAAAVASALALPGYWYLVVGGVVGSLAAAVRDADPETGGVPA